MVNSIIIQSQDGNKTELKLNIGVSLYTVEKILETRNVVKEDLEYVCFIDADEDVSRAKIIINDEEQDTYIDGNKILFAEYTDGRLFKNNIGFVQFVVCLPTETGDVVRYYSEYASVLIPSSRKNQSIDRMLNYIYSNQADVLRRQSLVTDIGTSTSEKYDDFSSQLIILEEIVNVYEANYGYFKANCKYRLEEIETIDRVDHLKYVDAKTVQYMTQHPEYLKREHVGIKYGRQSFLPTKTLMLQSRETKDIYENQIVLAFLKKVVSECDSLRKKINNYVNTVEYSEYEAGTYIVSSYLLYKNAYETLQKYDAQIANLEERLNVLFVSYQQALSISDVNIDYILRPTQIFLSVPQYNRVYVCMLKWSRKTGYDFSKERTLLKFMNAPQIYEAYVLAKLVNQIKSWGYQLAEARKVIYPDVDFKQAEYNNTFILKDGENTVTVYYEPIIYNYDCKINGISLYRNNTVSISKDGVNASEGFYYCPDYLIKAEVNGQERYVICDAKYSFYNKVRSILVPQLAYKYLYSISSCSENALICGMNIFYGLIGDEHLSSNFYNSQDGREITPFTYLIPMTEEIDWEEQEENLFVTFKKLIST